MLTTFAGITGVIFVLHAGVLVVQYCIASLFSRRNPFRCLWTMMPAYFGIGHSIVSRDYSVTLNRVIAMGVDRDVADS